MKTYMQEYYAAHREELLAREKERYHKKVKVQPDFEEKRKKRQKEYYAANKDTMLAKGAAYRARREYHKHESRYNGIKSRAKKRGMEFDLTLDFLSDLEQKTPVCPMLGVQLLYAVGYTDARNPNKACLDRIDNTKGYTMDNVHFISERANKIKNDASLAELVAITNYLVSLEK